MKKLLVFAAPVVAAGIEAGFFDGNRMIAAIAIILHSPL